MKTGKCIVTTVVLSGVLMLSGCSAIEDLTGMAKPKWEPTETALQVKADGTITETIIDTLDQNYYVASDLESMIKTTVSEYNSTHSSDALVIDSLSTEGGNIRLVMTYKSSGDYAEYNNVRFFSGSMLGAEMDGFLFYNQFREVKDGEVVADNLSNQEAIKHKEYQVLVTECNDLVQVPGNVKYISANAMAESKQVVRKSKIVAADEDILVLPSSAEYVEEKHAPVSAKDLEKTFLYVIYEY